MKKRLVVALVLSICLLSSVAWVWQGERPARTTWEYKVAFYPEHNPTERSYEQWLNAQGAEGWELVDRFSPTNPDSRRTVIFKRPK